MLVEQILKLLILLISLSNCFSEEITGYFKTEAWLETDHFGSGFHFIPDRSRPNIWIRVFKYDGAVSEVVGLPNNNTVGRHSNWQDVNWNDENNQMMSGGDYHRLIQRIDFNLPLGQVNPGSTSCGGGRCYGDWLNNDAVWDYSIKDYLDNKGLSFLKVSNKMNGKIRTRYRFQIYIEDNTGAWYKDASRGYDLGTHQSNSNGTKQYYPLKDVVFRITEGSTDLAIEKDPSQSTNHEVYIRKSVWEDKSRPDDFDIRSTPTNSRWVNGRLVYNFSHNHQFRRATDYLISVHAIDIHGNDRVLRFPMKMSPVGTVNIQNSTSEGHRN